MGALGRTVAWSVVSLAIVAGGSVVVGQGRGEPGDLGSLAALTSEVRELRLAVRQLAQTQSRTQALGVYLSAQQGRVLQVSSQLDATRKEVEGAAARSTELGARLADLQDELPRASDPMQRAAIRDAIPPTKREYEAATLQEQQARAREQELSQSLQTEESRWSSLISRLEALIGR